MGANYPMNTLRPLLGCAALAFLVLPPPVIAQPITLKLAFHTSDSSYIYQAAIKPFVEAVNADGNGIIKIDVHFSGALGKTPALQWQAVRDGKADIAFVIPGQLPGQFRDSAIIEFPGLFQNIREATLVFTRLVASGAIADYRDYYVIGAIATEPETIHTRPPVKNLDDLRGKRLRVNNPILAATLGKLGMTGVVMPIYRVAEEISAGKIDGAAVPPSPLFEYGIGRVAIYHFLLPISSAPFALLMSRQKFDSLPKQAQDIIRKFSGEWTAERFIERFEAVDASLMERLKSDSRRKVIVPAQSEMNKAALAFNAVTDDAISGNSRLRELLALAQSELARLRSSK
jgi:TRAP-type C4-dicarboxylate transport system substrate-binding protein